MNKMIDLENHVSMTSANQVAKIIRPLKDAFGITYFRYLKLYKDGKRMVLTNNPDAIRFLYEEGRYQHMWFDGGFPDFLRKDWYAWKTNRANDTREVSNIIEKEINLCFGVYHGLTLVLPSKHCYELFSFDTVDPSIYHIDKSLLARFIPYFREKAKKLIDHAEAEKIILPITQDFNALDLAEKKEKLDTYLSEIKVDRYYLGENYKNTYLTAKEMSCIQGIIQGKTADEIAQSANCQTTTVHRHLENIKSKLNCHKQAEIVKIALESEVFQFID